MGEDKVENNNILNKQILKYLRFPSGDDYKIWGLQGEVQIEI